MATFQHNISEISHMFLEVYFHMAWFVRSVTGSKKCVFLNPVGGEKNSILYFSTMSSVCNVMFSKGLHLPQSHQNSISAVIVGMDVHPCYEHEPNALSTHLSYDSFCRKQINFLLLC